MKIVKKVITKEDGRALTYYHFRDSATDSQVEAFNSVCAPETPLNNKDQVTEAKRESRSQGDANV